MSVCESVTYIFMAQLSCSGNFHTSACALEIKDIVSFHLSQTVRLSPEAVVPNHMSRCLLICLFSSVSFWCVTTYCYISSVYFM